MRFDEIRNNAEIMATLRWDLTPETGSIGNHGSYEINNQADLDRLPKLLAEKAGYYFYVDVWNCQARLALMQNLPSGGGRSEVIIDFHSPLLVKAVEDAGGWINQSGWYPLSARLVKVLKVRLGEGEKAGVRKVDFQNEKWQFDQAMEHANWDQEAFDWMIAETIKGLDAAEKNEFWKQHNEWKRGCQE